MANSLKYFRGEKSITKHKKRHTHVGNPKGKGNAKINKEKEKKLLYYYHNMKDLSYRDIAKLTGISHSTIYRYFLKFKKGDEKNGK